MESLFLCEISYNSHILIAPLTIAIQFVRQQKRIGLKFFFFDTVKPANNGMWAD